MQNRSIRQVITAHLCFADNFFWQWTICLDFLKNLENRLSKIKVRLQVEQFVFLAVTASNEETEILFSYCVRQNKIPFVKVF